MLPCTHAQILSQDPCSDTDHGTASGFVVLVSRSHWIFLAGSAANNRSNSNPKCETPPRGSSQSGPRVWFILSVRKM